MNKKITVLFLFISLISKGQNFDKVAEKVTKYPVFYKVENLAERISKDFISDEDKVRAAFFWLAKNIRYNLKEYYNPKKKTYRFSYKTIEEKEQKLKKLKDGLVAETFLNKMGVCEEYAQSFKKICDLLYIESEVIKGNVRNHSHEIGVVVKSSNHAWNAVKLNDKWMILDATWAAGYVFNGKWEQKFNPYYFDISKRNIFKTHFPKNSLWVLRFGRMTAEEFFDQPIYGYTFLNKSIQIISPKTGIITVDRSREIVLKMKNLNPETSVIYIFGNQQIRESPKITFQQNSAELKIRNPQKNTELIIFIDNSLALQYKVVMN